MQTVKTLMMGKTPQELKNMGVANFHIKTWIVEAIEKRHPKWYCLYGKYYYDAFNDVSSGIEKNRDGGYYLYRPLHYLERLFELYSHCFPPFKYPELESDGF